MLYGTLDFCPHSSSAPSGHLSRGKGFGNAGDCVPYGIFVPKAVDKPVETVSKLQLTGTLDSLSPVFCGQNKSFCIDTPLNFWQCFAIMDGAKMRNFQKFPFFDANSE